MRNTQNSNKPLYGTQHSDLSEIKSLAVAFMGILVLNIFSLAHVSNSIPCHISHITCAEARTLAWEKANVLTVIFGWFLIFPTPAGMLDVLVYVENKWTGFIVYYTHVVETHQRILNAYASPSSASSKHILLSHVVVAGRQLMCALLCRLHCV